MSLLLGLDFSRKQCVMVSQGCLDLVWARKMIQSDAWGQLQTAHYQSLVCISVSSGILLLKLCYTSCEIISAVREMNGGGRDRCDYVLLMRVFWLEILWWYFPCIWSLEVFGSPYFNSLRKAAVSHIVDVIVLFTSHTWCILPSCIVLYYLRRQHRKQHLWDWMAISENYKVESYLY